MLVRVPTVIEEEANQSTPQWQWSTGKSDTKSTQRRRRNALFFQERRSGNKKTAQRLREERAKKKSLRNKHYNEKTAEKTIICDG